jgi:hypothetical protein
VFRVLDETIESRELFLLDQLIGLFKTCWCVPITRNSKTCKIVILVIGLMDRKLLLSCKVSVFAQFEMHVIAGAKVCFVLDSRSNAS